MPDIQVPASHYQKTTYLNPERWQSYWNQFESVRSTSPENVLEIGIGNSMVRGMLSSAGYTIRTVDIDPALNPDHVASVTKLPFTDKAFDTVLCAEVLEHLQWDESIKAMAEIQRVAKKYAIITLPHSGYVFSLIFKLPLLSWKKFGFKIPHFWKKHEFKGQHFWETGKRGYPIRRLRRALQGAGLVIAKEKIFPDDPSHVVFICRKK